MDLPWHFATFADPDQPAFWDLRPEERLTALQAFSDKDFETLGDLLWAEGRSRPGAGLRAGEAAILHMLWREQVGLWGPALRLSDHSPAEDRARSVSLRTWFELGSYEGQQVPLRERAARLSRHHTAPEVWKMALLQRRRAIERKSFYTSEWLASLWALAAGWPLGQTSEP